MHRVGRITEMGKEEDHGRKISHFRDSTHSSRVPAGLPAGLVSMLACPLEVKELGCVGLSTMPSPWLGSARVVAKPQGKQT